MKYLVIDQFAAHDLKIEKLTNLNQTLRLSPLRVQITEQRPKYLLTGQELYQIDKNDNLKLIDTNWDTSDCR